MYHEVYDITSEKMYDDSNRNGRTRKHTIDNIPVLNMKWYVI